MILVVDSGSTKTDWIALDNKGEEIFSTQTLGLNPQMLSNEILNERIKNNFEIYKNRKSVKKLFFYGAGCGVDSTQERILKVFKSIFTNSEFDIKEDTYAAVYSAVDIGTPSIVNIIGTGSNCSYYDGKDVIQKVQSLGYVLMDYHSGQILAEANADDTLNPASLTKLMTSYVIGQEVKRGNISLDDQVTISRNAWAQNFPDSSKMWT